MMNSKTLHKNESTHTAAAFRRNHSERQEGEGGDDDIASASAAAAILRIGRPRGTTARKRGTFFTARPSTAPSLRMYQDDPSSSSIMNSPLLNMTTQHDGILEIHEKEEEVFSLFVSRMENNDIRPNKYQGQPRNSQGTLLQIIDAALENIEDKAFFDF